MIRYLFELDSGRTLSFEIDPERRPAAEDDPALPEWTRLEHARCPNCPLSAAEHSRCPAAVDVHTIIERFADVASVELAQVTVVTPEREIRKRCDVQSALNSLLGLVMATGACPHLSSFKAMARTHLPFATFEETLVRAVSTWLLREFYRARRGEVEKVGLEGLEALYQELGKVNAAFVQRIKGEAVKDAIANAIVTFFNLSTMVSTNVNKHLGRLESRFLG